MHVYVSVYDSYAVMCVCVSVCNSHGVMYVGVCDSHGVCMYVLVYMIPKVHLWRSLPFSLIEAESLVLPCCIHQASWPVRFWFFIFYLHRNAGIINVYYCINVTSHFWKFELWSSRICDKCCIYWAISLSRVSFLRQTGLYLSVAQSGLKYLEILQLHGLHRAGILAMSHHAQLWFFI